MEEKRYLTFALGKGRLAKKTLELFEKIGITCDEIRDPDTRKLIFVNEELGLRFFPCQGIGCAYICRVWCSRYWNCRKRHDFRRVEKYL